MSLPSKVASLNVKELNVIKKKKVLGNLKTKPNQTTDYFTSEKFIVSMDV